MTRTYAHIIADGISKSSRLIQFIPVFSPRTLSCMQNWSISLDVAIIFTLLFDIH